MIKDVIFICGLGGDAGMTYVSELKKFCESKGWNFYAPHMPSFEDGITYNKYRESFENLLKTKTFDFSKVLMIGQSAGTNFIVKYFAENNIVPGGYISCAGFFGQADQKVSDETKRKLSIVAEFYPTKEQYEKFKEMPFKKFSIYGGKDCFFTIKNLTEYANRIGAEKIYDENGVHGTISENITKHRLLHKVIQENF